MVVQAERLHELAFELEESIGGFNLDGNGVDTGGRPTPTRPTAGKSATLRALPAGKPKPAKKIPVRRPPPADPNAEAGD